MDNERRARLRRRRRNWVLMLVAGGGVLLAHLASSPEVRTTQYLEDWHGVRIIAHQGGDGQWPGNTLFALGKANGLGVDVLEFDVQMTRDGELVLLHDDTVDRTTEASGAVAAMDAATVAALDAGHDWADASGATPYRGKGIGVPTLDAALARFPRRMVIEIKPPGGTAAETLCARLAAQGAVGRVLVASFHADALDAYRAACPGGATSMAPGEVRALWLLSRIGLERLVKVPAAVAQVPERLDDLTVVDARFVAAAHALGLRVEVWTVNDPEDMRRLVALGVDGLITDVPDVAIATLSARQGG